MQIQFSFFLRIKWLVGLLLGLIYFASAGYSQTYWIPKTQLLDSLYNWNCNISGISKNTLVQNFLPIYSQKSPTSQVLVKNKKGLFILVEGTGQVYKASQQTAKQIAFSRVDSTFYSGYNFQSINFSFHDTLFSYGGSGFWLTNGHLRYFEEGGEWNLLELEGGVYPTCSFVYNILSRKSKFYFVQFIRYEKYGNYNNGGDGIIIELDLNKKTNKILGSLNTKITGELNRSVDKKFVNAPINIESLEGVLYFTGNNIYLLRFIDNTIYKLVTKTIIEKFTFSSNDNSLNMFEKDGFIYYTRVSDSTMHRFPISISDFVKQPGLLYEPVQSNKSFYFFIAGFCLITLLVFGVTKLYNSKKSNTVTFIADSKDFNTVDDLNFTGTELSLIKQIIVKLKNNEMINVDEVNNALGLNKKSLEIQKKIRTETINRINHKFNVKYKKETLLIERVRSDTDRRFYLYTINKENAILVSQV